MNSHSLVPSSSAAVPDERTLAIQANPSLALYWTRSVAGLLESEMTDDLASYWAERIMSMLFNLPETRRPRPASERPLNVCQASKDLPSRDGLPPLPEPKGVIARNGVGGVYRVHAVGHENAPIYSAQELLDYGERVKALWVKAGEQPRG